MSIHQTPVQGGLPRFSPAEGEGEGEGEGEDEDEDDEDGGVELGLGLEEEVVREDVVRVAVDMGGWI